MAQLWKFFDGEPYMINEPRRLMGNPKLLLFGNPRKSKKTKVRKNKPMAKAKRRTSTTRKSNPPKTHHRKASRRASYKHNLYLPNKRRHKRNPPETEILGFNLMDVAYGAGGVLLSPILENQLAALLPTSLVGTSGRWLVKIATAAGLVYVGGKAFGKGVRNVLGIALGSNLLSEAVNEFVIPPTVPTTTTTTTTTTGRYIGNGTRVAAYLPAAVRVGSFSGPSRVTGPFPAPF